MEFFLYKSKKKKSIISNFIRVFTFRFKFNVKWSHFLEIVSIGKDKLTGKIIQFFVYFRFDLIGFEPYQPLFHF